jgi:hypothetical protein
MFRLNRTAKGLEKLSFCQDVKDQSDAVVDINCGIFNSELDLKNP